MKKIVFYVLTVLCSLTALGAEKAPRDYTVLKGLDVAVGVPNEYRDLEASGLNIHIGYDCAYPITEKFGLGFYLSGGAGFIGEWVKYSKYDHYHTMLKLSAGVMMRIGNPEKRPFLVGFAPCTGMGFYDMDLILPIEGRFGGFITDRWYLMCELIYGYSLAEETACLEPAIRVGYNFGRKISRKGKKGLPAD